MINNNVVTWQTIPLPARPASWCWSRMLRAGPQLIIKRMSGKLTPILRAVVAMTTLRMLVLSMNGLPLL